LLKLKTGYNPNKNLSPPTPIPQESINNVILTNSSKELETSSYPSIDNNSDNKVVIEKIDKLTNMFEELKPMLKNLTDMQLYTFQKVKSIEKMLEEKSLEKNKITLENVSEHHPKIPEGEAKDENKVRIEKANFLDP
jgi:hypothetical protein